MALVCAVSEKLAVIFIPDICASCNRLWDVEEDLAKAEAHGKHAHRGQSRGGDNGV